MEYEQGSEMKADDERFLKWIFKSPQETNGLTRKSNFENFSEHCLFEIGPRFNFSTAESTNAVGICQSINLKSIKRIETSVRYLIICGNEESRFSAVNEVLLIIIFLTI